MNDVAEVPFDQLLIKVIDNRGKTCPVVDAGIPLIATNCIKNDKLFPVFEKVRYVNEETMLNWFRGHPKPGDILFVTKGTPGRVAWVPDPVNFCIAQDMVALQVDETKVVPKYLFAALRSNTIQGEIENLHVGSLIPHFKKGDFGRLLIPVPNLDTQKYIGEMYFTLSYKIDLLHRNNKTLEEMAETLFRQWFVEGAMEDWEVKQLDDILTTVGGTTPSTSNPEFWNGDIAWTSPRDITTLNGIYLFDTERKITEQGLKKVSSGILPAGTLLMSSRAPVGVLAFAEIPVSINQGYIAILDNKGYDKIFIYLWLKQNMELVHSYSNGSTFMEISKSAFRSLEINIPPKKLVTKFISHISDIFIKIRHNEKSIKQLIITRDSLLPKLMSGQVRVQA